MGEQGQVDPEGNCSVEVREKRRKIENEMSCAMAANWVEISLAKKTTEQGRAGPPPASPSPLPTSLPRFQSISFQMQFAKGHAHTSTSLTHSKTTTIKAEKKYRGKIKQI